MFDELKLKAENHLLEVEDLVDLAVAKNTDAIPFLKQAIDDYQWDDVVAAKTSNKVPLATWATVVVAYLEEGYDGLKRYVCSETGEYLSTSEFVLALLGVIKNKETIKGIIELFGNLINKPEISYLLSLKLVSAVNRLLSFPPLMEIDNEDKEVLRTFVYRFLSLYGEEENPRCTGFCALRGVGDLDSIKKIKSYPKLSGPYEGTESIVIKL
ncbi:hypothetical protein [Vibrio sonorensis]|uniref:hypothetical protein n=1 Tax=Vibrio sonorensis TaxID=1004316 RepID=UPI0008D91BAD|nr:hypothetical protein [Vibrio sonorensis]